MKINSLMPYSDYLAWLMKEINHTYTNNSLNPKDFRHNYRSDRFVELKLAYKNSDGDIPSGHDNYCFHAYNHFFAEEQNNNIIKLYGPAGSGKTTFIFHVLYAFHRDFCYFHDKAFKFIPIYFYYRDFQDYHNVNDIKSVKDLLKQHSEYEQINAYIESMKENYPNFEEKYRYFYILDDFHNYEKIIDVETLVASLKEHDKLFFLTTSKNTISSTRVNQVEICDLYDKHSEDEDKDKGENRKVRSIIHRFLEINKKNLNITTGSLSRELNNFIDNKLVSESLRNLSKIPRYLGKLIEYHFIKKIPLPDTRFELYEEILVKEIKVDNLVKEIKVDNNKDKGKRLFQTNNAKLSFLSLVLSKINTFGSLDKNELIIKLQKEQSYIINYCGFPLLNEIMGNVTGSLEVFIKQNRLFIYYDDNNKIQSANHPLESFLISYYPVEQSLTNNLINIHNNDQYNSDELIEHLYSQIENTRYDENNDIDSIIYLLLTRTNLSYTLSTIIKCFSYNKADVKYKIRFSETILRHLVLESYHRIEETKLYVIPLIVLQLIGTEALASSTSFSHMLKRISTESDYQTILSTTHYLQRRLANYDDAIFSIENRNNDHIDYNSIIEEILPSGLESEGLYQETIKKITQDNLADEKKRTILLDNTIFILTSFILTSSKKEEKEITKRCYDQLKLIQEYNKSNANEDIRKVIFNNIRHLTASKEQKNEFLYNELPLDYSIHAANIINFIPNSKTASRKRPILSSIKGLHPYHSLIINNNPTLLKLLYQLTLLVELIVVPDNDSNKIRLKENRNRFYQYIQAKVNSYSRYYPQHQETATDKILSNLSSIRTDNHVELNNDVEQKHILLRSCYYYLLADKKPHNKSFLKFINDLLPSTDYSFEDAAISLCLASARYGLKLFKPLLEPANNPQKAIILEIINRLSNNQELSIENMRTLHRILSNAQKIRSILDINEPTLDSFITSEFINQKNSAGTLFQTFYEENVERQSLSYSSKRYHIYNEKELSKYELLLPNHS